MVETAIAVSVVIPNLNSSFINQTLEALRSQDFDLSRVEVLVVGMDNPGLVREDSLVRMISTKKPVNPAVARNIGIRAAKGDIICFTDADCLADQDWLKRITIRFTEPHVKVVGGGVDFETNNYWTLCDNLSWFHEFLVTSPRKEREILPSLNLAIHRSVIDSVGFFDETYPQPGGEDADWTIRLRIAGFDLHFEPTAIVIHCPTRATLKKFWQHSFTYGRFSTKIDPKYDKFLKTPFFLKNWPILALVTPLLSGWATLKVLFGGRRVAKIWLVGPGIFIGKVAWCLGAISTLMRLEKNIS